MRGANSTHAPHRYKSTACHHRLHEECRQACKFCEAGCECDCHTRRGDDAVTLTTHLELDIPDDVAIDLCWLADRSNQTPHELAAKALRWYVTAARRRTHK